MARRVLTTIFVGVGLLAGAVAPVAAEPGTAAPRTAASVTPAGVQGEARADFNGDGYADLAVGAPYDTISGARRSQQGTVSVLYGSRGGVTTRDQLWQIGRAHV